MKKYLKGYDIIRQYDVTITANKCFLQCQWNEGLQNHLLAVLCAFPLKYYNISL